MEEELLIYLFCHKKNDTLLHKLYTMKNNYF